MKKYIKVTILLLVALSVFLVGPGRPERDFSVPVSNYMFRVEINGIDAGYFASVEGLSIEQLVIEYEDSDTPLIQKSPGKVKYGDIILRRGYLIGTVLNDWIEASRMGDDKLSRKNMSIILIDTTPPWTKGVEIKRWNCFECFPRFWKLSTLSNEGNNLVTEEMVIVVEWFEEVEPGTYLSH